MNQSLESLLSALGLLLLRVGVGSMMLFGHGLGKLLNYSEMSTQFPDPIGLGPQVSLIATIFAEFVCAGLLIVGAATRLAALPLAFTMLVAAGVVHGADPWAKKEFALLFAIPCLTLMLTGGGMFSLDALLLKRRGRRA